jgi:hypothetical protein
LLVAASATLTTLKTTSTVSASATTAAATTTSATTPAKTALLSASAGPTGCFPPTLFDVNGLSFQILLDSLLSLSLTMLTNLTWPKASKA